jgi:hypothetical protein
MTGTPSERQGDSLREGTASGSRTQNPGPRNTNRMRPAELGEVAWQTEPDVIRKRSRYMRRVDGMKVTRLTPGGLGKRPRSQPAHMRTQERPKEAAFEGEPMHRAWRRWRYWK